MTIEIVDLPIHSMVIYSYVLSRHLQQLQDEAQKLKRHGGKKQNIWEAMGTPEM